MHIQIQILSALHKLTQPQGPREDLLLLLLGEFNQFLYAIGRSGGGVDLCSHFINESATKIVQQRNEERLTFIY